MISLENNDIAIYATTDSETNSSSDESDLLSEASSYDSDDFEIIDDIYRNEIQFINTDKINNHYYLGLYEDNLESFIMTNSMSVRNYFTFPHQTCLDYLFYYGDSVNASFKNIDILKLQIAEGGVYNVIVKTFWLKIVQRRWKSIFRKRMLITKKRCTLYAIQYRERNGKWPDNLQHIPSLQSMLIC